MHVLTALRNVKLQEDVGRALVRAKSSTVRAVPDECETVDLNIYT